jgi:hypothetical protein
MLVEVEALAIMLVADLLGLVVLVEVEMVVTHGQDHLHQVRVMMG